MTWPPPSRGNRDDQTAGARLAAGLVTLVLVALLATVTIRACLLLWRILP